MIKIFYDCEFTELTLHAQLISIGLIDESSEHTFYAEANDAYEPWECSDFVRFEVLPHLEGGSTAMPKAELKERLTDWLTGFGEEIVLVSDSNWDVYIMNGLFREGWPTGVSHRIIQFSDTSLMHFKNRADQIQKAQGLLLHHALDDARVNRQVMLDNADDRYGRIPSV